MSEAEFLREVSLVLAAVSCSTSIMSMFRPPITGSIPRLISRPFPSETVGEIHLAGHAVDKRQDGASAADRFAQHAGCGNRLVAISAGARATGAVPTLIEWDNDVPPFPILSGEVARARCADRGRDHAPRSGAGGMRLVREQCHDSRLRRFRLSVPLFGGTVRPLRARTVFRCTPAAPARRIGLCGLPQQRGRGPH